MKLGRLAATRPHGLKDLAVYAQGKLPAPPDTVPAPVVDWRMDLNDTYGICTIAGVDHLIAAWDEEVKENDPRPNDSELLSTYMDLTGGADTGLNEALVLQQWQSKGLFGTKIAGYAPVHPQDIVALHQAIAFYGGAYLGIMCPESCKRQAVGNQPWTYVPNSPIEGGHCIVAVGYDQFSVKCVSWGKLVDVSYGFLAHYLEEAWAILGQEMVEAKGDALGIDLVTLQADLVSL